MTRHRSLAVVLAAMAALAVTAGTGGFSAAEADRAFVGTILDDERAYLGITVEGTTGTVDETFTLLELSDNFPQNVWLESVSLPGGAPVRVQYATMDGPVVVECTDPASGESVTLTIEASGQGVHVRKHKQVTVTCYEPTPTPTPTPASTPTPTPTPASTPTPA